jgi:CRISPR type III-B/RAMP module-associated protein Cmr5
MASTFESKMAELAGALVKSQKLPDQEADYRALCESFPMLLRTCGLVQTLAFMDARKERPQYAALRGHLEQQFVGLGLLKEGESLSARLRVRSEYRMYTQLALRIAYWHKILAQALLDKRAA